MRARRLCSLVMIGALLAACGVQSAGVTATRSRQLNADTVPTTTPDSVPPDTGGTAPPDTRGTPPTTTGDTTSPINSTPVSGPTISIASDQKVIDFGSSKVKQDYDGFLVSAFQDIEAFWGKQFPATYGKSFKPLAKGIYAAYPTRTEKIPGCGTAETRYTDIEGNAFYCGDGDFVVYDDNQLMPELVKSLGQSAVGVVLAHEFGHAIQNRAGEFAQPTILKEQQADCFAGAWAAHISRGEAPGLTFGDKELKQGLIAMIQVRDPVKLQGSNGDPHGTGFDRVGAFQDGYVGGTARCKTFFTEGREKTLIDIPFQPGDVNAGNLPFSNGTGQDLVTLIPQDLTRYWQATMSAQGVTFTAPTVTLYPQKGPFPTCDGVPDDAYPKNVIYCPSTNQVLVDQDFGAKLDANPLYGDLSIGSLIGQGYAEAVQRALGSKLTGKERALADDCLTGGWAKDDVPPLPADRQQNGISLSAGDLDEVVITTLGRSDDTADQNNLGTAFEKISAFREGVFGGYDACKARLG